MNRDDVAYHCPVNESLRFLSSRVFFVLLVRQLTSFSAACQRSCCCILRRKSFVSFIPFDTGLVICFSQISFAFSLSLYSINTYVRTLLSSLSCHEEAASWASFHDLVRRLEWVYYFWVTRSQCTSTVYVHRTHYLSTMYFSRGCFCLRVWTKFTERPWPSKDSRGCKRFNRYTSKIGKILPSKFVWELMSKKN